MVKNDSARLKHMLEAAECSLKFIIVWQAAKHEIPKLIKDIKDIAKT